MRLSAIDFVVVICFGLAIAALYAFHVNPRWNAQNAGCNAPLVPRGYLQSGPLAGYCLVFGVWGNGPVISSPLPPPASPHLRGA